MYCQFTDFAYKTFKETGSCTKKERGLIGIFN